jgi:hypothetical protein
VEPPRTGLEGISHDEPLVHAWRVSQLTRLGIPLLLAEVHADHVDWHQIARLVQHGCPARLAIRIAC